MPDKLTINRWSNAKESKIDISIEDETGRMIYRGTITPEEFALAITGRAIRPIERDPAFRKEEVK
jgi:hypothetical protein